MTNVNSVKVGDLVRGWYHDVIDPDTTQLGIIIEVIDHIEVPPVCKVLWSSGEIDKVWTDDIDIIDKKD